MFNLSSILIVLLNSHDILMSDAEFVILINIKAVSYFIIKFSIKTIIESKGTLIFYSFKIKALIWAKAKIQEREYFRNPTCKRLYTYILSIALVDSYQIAFHAQTTLLVQYNYPHIKIYNIIIYTLCIFCLI